MNMSTDGATSSGSYGALDAERPVAVVSWTWRDTAECARRRVMSFLHTCFLQRPYNINAHLVRVIVVLLAVVYLLVLSVAISRDCRSRSR